MEWSGKAFGGDNIWADTWMKWRSESWWYLEEERPRQRTQHKRRLWGRNRHGLFQELWEGNVAGNRVKGERSGSKRCLRAGQGADNVGWITRRSLLTEQKTYIMVHYRFTVIPLKLPMVFFRELEQIISQFVWNYQKTLKSQSNLEKEEWNWRSQPAWLQAVLHSNSHQDSMILAQRQKHRSMEQNRKPWDKSMHVWTPYLWQRRQEYRMEKRQSL